MITIGVHVGYFGQWIFGLKIIELGHLDCRTIFNNRYFGHMGLLDS